MPSYNESTRDIRLSTFLISPTLRYLLLINMTQQLDFFIS